MTALGTDAPNVAGLVYIAAFGLDQGESIGGLLVSHPDEVTELIRTAAAAVAA
jgi:hypothetical protein